MKGREGRDCVCVRKEGRGRGELEIVMAASYLTLKFTPSNPPVSEA